MPGPRTAASGLVATRSLLVGLLTVATTALAHAAAGGAMPGIPGLAVLVLATSATAWPVLRRDVRPALLFGMVGSAQVVLHPGFQALAPASGHPGHHPVTWVMVLAHLAAGLGAVALVLAVDPVMRQLGAVGGRRHGAAPVIGRPAVPPGPPPPSPLPARVAADAPRRGPPGGCAPVHHRSRIRRGGRPSSRPIRSLL